MIILLDSIERWSTIGSEFSQCYKELIDAGITFPSSFKVKTPLKNDKKQVSFSLQNSEIGERLKTDKSDVKMVQIDESKKKAIAHLKKRMTKVKNAMRKCKKFLKNAEQGAMGDPQDQSILRKHFAHSRKLASKCCHDLKSQAVGDHVSNSKHL